MAGIATIGQLLAGLVLLFGNGYFVTIEFAMTRVRQFSRDEFTGSSGLERAWEMTEQLEIYLSGCQLGITICSVGLGFVAEPALAVLIDPVVKSVGLASAGTTGHAAISVALALGIINILHVVVGEQAPTYLGIERTKTIAKYGAPILYWWTTILSPVIRFADRIAKALLRLFGVEITRSWAEEEVEGEEPPETRGELLSRMGSILTNMDMPAERRNEVINALAIDRILASDIMIDRDEIVALSTEASVAENFERMQGTPHSRFPLVREDLDEIEGIVYVPALLDRREELEAGDATFEDVAAPPMTVPPDLSVAELIDRFQDENQELALVVDDGETVGLVTATDAFEEIAGELEDPMDVEAE